jgi:GT2 family glycosyltransferase
MNPLIIYLQPKDGLGHIRNKLLNIPCDKLILKYFPYPDVYQIARKSIEKHPEYDIIVWLQNDINFDKQAFFKLIQGLKNWKLDILGCSMNVDLTPHGLQHCAFTVKKFEHEVKGLVNNEPPFVKKGTFRGLVKVYHNGGVFACTREFYLKFPLTGMGKGGYNADIDMGRRIWNAGINYFVDSEIHLKHERYAGTMQVGKKTPESQVIRW